MPDKMSGEKIQLAGCERELSAALEPAGMRFIPYYASNRTGAGPMAVWVPRGGQYSE